jgi:hypothetical protein
MWWAETVRYIGGQSGRFTIHNISLYSPLARIALDQNPNYPPILSLPDRKSSCSSRSLQFPRSLSRENPSPKSHAMGSKSRSDHPHSGDGASPGFVSVCVCVCVCVPRFSRVPEKIVRKREEEGQILDPLGFLHGFCCLLRFVSF